MWYNDLDGDHIRTYNKYVGALTKLLNMVGWIELIKVLTCYWDSKKMEFWFGTVEITPIVEEMRDNIDTVGIGLERRESKQEDILALTNFLSKTSQACLGWEKITLILPKILVYHLGPLR